MDDFSKDRPTSHTYFSQRLRLHYLDWGNRRKPHLVMVHGIRDHCHNWDWLAAGLCGDFHVVVPDQRGHGDSQWSSGSSYSLLEHLYDLSQLIHQESLQPVHLVAHSMGGTLASLYAGTYPENVASLTIIEGVGGFHHWRPREPSARKRIRHWIKETRNLAGRSAKRYESLEEAFHRMQKSNPHLDEIRARHLTIHGSNRNEDGTYSWKFDNYTHAHSLYDVPWEEMVELWQEITCPVFIVNAREGYPFRIGQDGTDRYFRNLEMAVIEQAGHWLHHDQFEEFLTRLREFLAKHLTPAPEDATSQP